MCVRDVEIKNNEREGVAGSGVSKVGGKRKYTMRVTDIDKLASILIEIADIKSQLKEEKSVQAIAIKKLDDEKKIIRELEIKIPASNS